MPFTLSAGPRMSGHPARQYPNARAAIVAAEDLAFKQLCAVTIWEHNRSGLKTRYRVVEAPKPPEALNDNRRPEQRVE